MTTVNDSLIDRINRNGPGAIKDGVFPIGIHDPSGVYPKPEHHYQSSLNRSSRGLRVNRLASNGGIPTFVPERNWDESTEIPEVAAASKGFSTYPNNQVQESPGGHIIEIDDTIGNERILIRHRGGAGIEIQPDGTILLSSTNNLLISVNNDNHIMVEGDAYMTYSGNVVTDIAGDYNVNVRGNYNLFTAGDITTQVDGNRRSTVQGNSEDTVSGHRDTKTAESAVTTTLGGKTEVVKTFYDLAVDGTTNLSGSETIKISAEDQIIVSSEDINIGATNLSVFGAEGTIGGENIIMYNYNMYTGHSAWIGETVNTKTVTATKTVNAIRMFADTFEGDLDGTADYSTQTQSQSYGDFHGDVGSKGSITNTAAEDAVFDQTETAKPDAALLDTYLNQGAYGIEFVKVDEGGHLYNNLNAYEVTGGITNRTQSTAEVRSTLRDNGTLNNADYTAAQVGAGKLNPTYSSPNPGRIGRVISGTPSPTVPDKTPGDV